jgi:uncharacterized protein
MEYNCQECGACCSYKWSWPVLRRNRIDAAQIPANMVRSDYPLMKTVNCRCVALIGEVGKQVSCAIYDNRPLACQTFKPGSELCQEARLSKGLFV